MLLKETNEQVEVLRLFVGVEQTHISLGFDLEQEVEQNFYPYLRWGESFRSIASGMVIPLACLHEGRP